MELVFSTPHSPQPFPFSQSPTPITFCPLTISSASPFLQGANDKPCQVPRTAVPKQLAWDPWQCCLGLRSLTQSHTPIRLEGEEGRPSRRGDHNQRPPFFLQDRSLDERQKNIDEALLLSCLVQRQASGSSLWKSDPARGRWAHQSRAPSPLLLHVLPVFRRPLPGLWRTPPTPFWTKGVWRHPYKPAGPWISLGHLITDNYAKGPAAASGLQDSKVYPGLELSEQDPSW